MWNIITIFALCANIVTPLDIDSLRLPVRFANWMDIIRDATTQGSTVIPRTKFNFTKEDNSRYDNADNSEDKELNITQLIKKYGYPVEEHIVDSQGYLLKVFRIPSKGRPVLLQHGLVLSADDWVTAGVNNALAYYLADQGLDVWMGNFRGNKHSRAHVSLSPDADAFWEFSYTEVGIYDTPAIIDYVLQETGYSKVIYIGHSQGHTALIVMCSEKPEYNDKVSLAIGMSGETWMPNCKSPVLKLLASLTFRDQSLLRLLSGPETLTYNTLIRTFKNLVCGLGWDDETNITRAICGNIVFLYGGFNNEQLDFENLPTIFSHCPSGTATRVFEHYLQSVKSGKFQKFDYGSNKNQELYGTEDPPAFKVENVRVPLVILYGDNDWVVPKEDIDILVSNLRTNVTLYRVDNFMHNDFVWARDVRELAYTKILEYIQNSINNEPNE